MNLTDKYELISNKNLFIRNISQSDAGTYACQASNHLTGNKRGGLEVVPPSLKFRNNGVFNRLTKKETSLQLQEIHNLRIHGSSPVNCKNQQLIKNSDVLMSPFRSKHCVYG